jgi:hypothetical protein
MTYEQLQHAIRAACDVAGDTELFIFGSQAILATFPNAPEGLRASIEVDVQPKNLPDRTDHVDGALGQDSHFHRTYGFYVHGVSIEAAKLPAGWEDRTVPVSDPHLTLGHIGHCLEAHDLTASKLAAFREKDREFAVTLLVEGLIDGRILQERVGSLPIEDELRQRLLTWVQRIMTEINGGV